MRNALATAAIAAVGVLCVIAYSSLRSVPVQQTPTSKSPASVNLAVLSAAAPFHDVLAQYDREIATLEYVRASSAPDAGKALEKDRKALRSEIDLADAHIRAINARRLNGLQQQELAISEELRETGDLSDIHDVAADIRLHPRKQFSAVDARANDDFASYRDDLASQEHNVLRKYELLLDSGMRGSYDAQAQMLRERESLLAFKLAQNESGLRLQTHARLQNLAPDPHERARLRSMLQTLDRQDMATIGEQREKDDVLLQSARVRLVAEKGAAGRRMQEHIEQTDAADLAERGRVADAQLGNAIFPTLPNGASDKPSLPNKLREFAASGQSNRQSRKTLDAFDSTRNVLTMRFALLSTLDASAKNATNAQIALLIRERLALRNEIAAFIIRNAQKLADQRNLGKVFPSNQAPRESIDITAEVQNNLKTSLSWITSR